MTTVNHHLILMAKPICHQSKIAICIHLILTDKKNVFKLCNNFETGLSGHHFLISTIMKSGYFKGPPKKKVRSYKNFNQDVFNDTLNMELHSVGNNNSNSLFEEKFLCLK